MSICVTHDTTIFQDFKKRQAFTSLVLTSYYRWPEGVLKSFVAQIHLIVGARLVLGEWKIG
jgi:hypothetical protein